MFTHNKYYMLEDKRNSCEEIVYDGSTERYNDSQPHNTHIAHTHTLNRRYRRHFHISLFFISPSPSSFILCFVRWTLWHLTKSIQLHIDLSLFSEFMTKKSDHKKYSIFSCSAGNVVSSFAYIYLDRGWNIRFKINLDTMKVHVSYNINFKCFVSCVSWWLMRH